MTLEEIIRKVSEEMNLPYDVCYKAYMSSWKFILEKAQALTLNDQISIDDFKKQRVNFNMPSLGKMNITEESFRKKIRRLEIIKEFKRKKDVQGKED